MVNILFLLLFLLMSFPWAYGGMCNVNNKEDRHDTEAIELENETYSFVTATGVTPVLNYKGDRDYNAHVIVCNRKRDTRGKRIEKNLTATERYEPDLEPRLVKGKYNYFGTIVTQLRYGYRIERSGGVWTVTVPIQFHFPKLKLTKYIDITMPLADELGINSTICATTVKKGGKTIRGLAARGRSTFSELRWYPPMEAAKGSLSWVFRAKQPESVRTGP